MNIVKSVVLVFGFLVLTSGIAYPFVIDMVDVDERVEVGIRNIQNGTELTLWSLNYQNQKSAPPMVTTVGPKTEIRISGKKSDYPELDRLNGREVMVSGKLVIILKDNQKLEEWISVNITPISPEKTK